jgi:hypothetical protein
MIVNDDDLERVGCSITPRVDRIDARFDVGIAVVRHDNDTNEILIGHFHDTRQAKSATVFSGSLTMRACAQPHMKLFPPNQRC